jgi:hypothetical protein
MLGERRLMENTRSTEVSKEAARLFLISRQGFLQGRRGKDGALEAISRLECIQTDPISVVHRNQHLVLHNRVRDYKPSHLEELLYKDRLVFEYWCNEKSIIPMKDFPYFRYRMKNPSQFHSPFYERIKARREELKEAASYVISEMKKYGPLSAQEVDKKGKIKRKVATSVLNLLWDCGDIMVHHLQGNRRCYDLTEHLVGPSTNIETPSREEYERFMIEKYMKANGFVDSRDWRFGWLPLKVIQRKMLIKELVENHKLIPVKIEGINHVYYVLEEYLHLLEDSDEPIGKEVYFIAPLDNLIWNRRMVLEIFDFNYSWEVYKIPEKRIYGYYVMPILYGGRFIGRLDPKLDRQNNKMIINSLLLEKKGLDRSLTSELTAALQRFLDFHIVSNLSIGKTQPPEIKNAIMRELS